MLIFVDIRCDRIVFIFLSFMNIYERKTPWSAANMTQCLFQTWTSVQKVIWYKMHDLKLIVFIHSNTTPSSFSLYA